VLELEAAWIDNSYRQPPEHERVVRIGAMSQSDLQAPDASNLMTELFREPPVYNLRCV
jgi:hypothetical protein